MWDSYTTNNSWPGSNASAGIASATAYATKYIDSINIVASSSVSQIVVSFNASTVLSGLTVTLTPVISAGPSLGRASRMRHQPVFTFQLSLTIKQRNEHEQQDPARFYPDRTDDRGGHYRYSRRHRHPAYQDYTKRARVTEGLSLASAAKTSVTEYYASNNIFPTSNASAGLATTISGASVSDVQLAIMVLSL
jgi:hypothetical protein